jgi:acetyl/propionyl-CoA carboxylase alpha subunit/acetyl-CoA carboxylase carboxyltransferase component
MVKPPVYKDFRRIAILNRGEAALRFLRAAREYEHARGVKLEPVVLYTDEDASAPWVRLGDDAIALGSAMRVNAAGLRVSAYTDHDFILEQLQRAKCEAVWPGWGFVSEDAVFVARLEAAGIVFLGPPSGAMKRLGDKIEARHLAITTDMPLAPWLIPNPDDAPEVLAAKAASIGYPMMVKASGAGGGRGIRRVDVPEGLLDAIEVAKRESGGAFGQSALFFERCITQARHIEVQVAVGADGVATALGIRDCSIQRRNQKVIEESPSAVVSAAAGDDLCRAAERLLEAGGYRGVATVEFLVQPADGTVCFLEVNSRLQVEHTVTEMVTGCDLVQAQIDIARGLPWQKPTEAPRGHAIEVRLNAEDPEKNFQPAPGIVRVFRPPAGPGVRVDAGIAEGMTIAGAFDSMIAKVIAWAPDRPQALARLERALRELQVVVEDGATNKGFLLDLLRHPEVVNSTADTGWLDRAMAQGELSTPRFEVEALLVAAVLDSQRRRSDEIDRFFAEVQGGVPRALPKPEGTRVELRLRGRKHAIDVYAIGRDRYLAGPASSLHPVTLEPVGPHTAVLHMAGRKHQVLYAEGAAGVAVDVDGSRHTVERAAGGAVRAPAPSVVVQIHVAEGDSVQPGDLLCTLEAMKMEMPLRAVDAGVVRSLHARANQQVAAGQTLLVLEEAGAASDEPDDATPTGWPDPQPRPLDALLDGGVLLPERLDLLDDAQALNVVQDVVAAVRSMLLGHDVPPELVERLHRLLGQDLDPSKSAHPERWSPIAALLPTFADTEAVFDRTLLQLGDESTALSADAAFHESCRRHREGETGTRPEFRPTLRKALLPYGVKGLEPGVALREALWRLAIARSHRTVRQRLCASVLRVVIELHEAGVTLTAEPDLRQALDRVAELALPEFAFMADNARQAAYLLFEQARYVLRRDVVAEQLDRMLGRLAAAAPATEAFTEALTELVRSPQPIFPLLLERAAPDALDAALVGQVLLRRVYASRIHDVRGHSLSHGCVVLDMTADLGDGPAPLVGILGRLSDLPGALAAARETAANRTHEGAVAVELALHGVWAPQTALDVPAAFGLWTGARPIRLTLSTLSSSGSLLHRTWSAESGLVVEDPVLVDIHPEAARRIELSRLQEFELERLPAPEQIVAFRGRARSNPEDERIFVFAEVRDVPDASPEPGRERDTHLWEFEQAWFEGLRIIREAQARRDPRQRLHWNRVTFYVRPVFRLNPRDVGKLAQRLEAPARGLGLEKVVLCCRVPDPRGGVKPAVLVISKPGRHRMQVELRAPTGTPIHALSRYEMQVIRARRLGNTYPYEAIAMLEGRVHGAVTPHPDMVNGRFAEYDLDATGERLVPVQRAAGHNDTGVVTGIFVHYTAKFPDGMERVWIASDPTHAMGALSEPECRRINAALDLAEERGIPVEWLPVSSGARIAMDSGTENLDWTARVLRRIIEFTQAGGEINVLVTGVNVGAQSYWNAEATMLMHTRGILVMTPEASMVLTGKKALEYSGGVAAEDERGIGGFERVMGPNGQAQYFAKDLGEAYGILFDHYRFTYRKPNEPGPRTLPTTDPDDRNVLDTPYKAGDGFATVGDIFDERTNPGRKKPFAIREVMAAVIDRDGGRLERFRTMLHAETAAVWDAHLGGQPVCLIGFESRQLPRRGRVPLDGPDSWSGGTLFPKSSKKVARAISQASGQRPVVVLANLSGFDGSPESLRKLQLEYGAEIGRAVVNFQGPIVFVVIGRYHGGAYVVFSKALNPNLTALAVEGSFASVIGGAPAAAVVFPREVRKRAEADPRVLAAKKALTAAPAGRRPRLREQYESVLADVVLEKQGEVAKEFDAVHSVERAVRVGSLDAVIRAAELRPAIIERLRAAQSEPSEDVVGWGAMGG